MELRRWHGFNDDSGGAMGYFLDYELTPCWYCGKADCSGNHPGTIDLANNLPHHKYGLGTPMCGCHVCANMRMREEKRRHDPDKIKQA